MLQLADTVMAASWHSVWSCWWSSCCAEEWQTEGPWETSRCWGTSWWPGWWEVCSASQFGKEDHWLGNRWEDADRWGQATVLLFISSVYIVCWIMWILNFCLGISQRLKTKPDAIEIQLIQNRRYLDFKLKILRRQWLDILQKTVDCCWLSYVIPIYSGAPPVFIKWEVVLHGWKRTERSTKAGEWVTQFQFSIFGCELKSNRQSSQVGKWCWTKYAAVKQK